VIVVPFKVSLVAPLKFSGDSPDNEAKHVATTLKQPVHIQIGLISQHIGSCNVWVFIPHM